MTWQWLELLLCIQEAQSLIGLEGKYLDWGFLWFPSIPPSKCFCSFLYSYAFI